MGVKISVTHSWSKLFVLISIFSRIASIVIYFVVWEEVLGLGEGGVFLVILIIGFIGVLALHEMTLGQFYHILSTYCYVNYSLKTKVSFSEARQLLILFAPNETGVWYPMTQLKELSKEYRREVLFAQLRQVVEEHCKKDISEED